MTTAGEASSAIIRVMKAPIPSMHLYNVIPMSALPAGASVQSSGNCWVTRTPAAE
jgi:hypothetical protein